MKTPYIIILGLFAAILLGSCSYLNPLYDISKGGIPVACQDEEEGMPVITKASDIQGSVGMKLTILGCNFSWSDGDKTAWIENDQGIKGMLHTEGGSTSKLLNITLSTPPCQTDAYYGDLGCENALVLIPGTYHIYVMPWGKVSNKMEFIITPSR